MGSECAGMGSDVQLWDQESQGMDGTGLGKGCKEYQEGIPKVHFSDKKCQGECTPSDGQEGWIGNDKHGEL